MSTHSQADDGPGAAPESTRTDRSSTTAERSKAEPQRCDGGADIDPVDGPGMVPLNAVPVSKNKSAGPDRNFTVAKETGPQAGGNKDGRYVDPIDGPGCDPVSAERASKSEASEQFPLTDPFDIDDQLHASATECRWGGRRFLRHPTAIAILALIGAGTALVVVIQFLFFVSYIAALPVVLRVLGWTLTIGLMAVIVGAFVWLICGYFRLKATPAIDLGALHALADRAALRKEVLEQNERAYDSLRAFVRNYTLDQKDGTRLKRLGFSAEELEALRDGQASLPDLPLANFKRDVEVIDGRFLQILDKVAKRRVRKYALLVGVKTGVLRTGLLDTLVVVANAFLMVGDLCRIYQLRATSRGTALIAARIFLNVFTAGQMEEWGDQAAESMFGPGAAEGLEDDIKELVGMAVIGKAFAGRAMESAANALLFYRLGAATCVHLRPLHRQHNKDA